VTATAVLAGLALPARTMVVLTIVGKSRDEADRKGGEDARRLRRRAMWLGVEETVSFLAVCAALGLRKET
jgi:hypothetical protein